MLACFRVLAVEMRGSCDGGYARLPSVELVDVCRCEAFSCCPPLDTRLVWRSIIVNSVAQEFINANLVPRQSYGTGSA